MAKVTGIEEFKRELAARRKKLEVYLGQAAFVIADRVKARAQHSITEGSIYGKGHVASEPGEPPNGDLPNLHLEIASKPTGPVSAEVRSQAPYSAALEFGWPGGTKDSDAPNHRPFMRPAADAERPAAIKLMKKAKQKAFS